MSAAYNILVTDAVPVGVVVDPSSIRPAASLTGADPVRGGGTITWDAADLPGPLAPGVTVDLALHRGAGALGAADHAALVNTARIALLREPRHRRAGLHRPSATAQVTPRSRSSGPQDGPRPGPGLHRAALHGGRSRVTNSGGATAFGIDVTDILPVGWEYVDGHAQGRRAGGGVQAVDAVVAGRVLLWSDLGSLSRWSVVVTFSAAPGADVVTAPGVGGLACRRRTVRVGFGDDATGAPGNAVAPTPARPPPRAPASTPPTSARQDRTTSRSSRSPAPPDGSPCATPGRTPRWVRSGRRHPRGRGDVRLGDGHRVDVRGLRR